MAWDPPPVVANGQVLTPEYLNALQDSIEETLPAKAVGTARNGAIFMATGANAWATFEYGRVRGGNDASVLCEDLELSALPNVRSNRGFEYPPEGDELGIRMAALGYYGRYFLEAL